MRVPVIAAALVALGALVYTIVVVPTQPGPGEADEQASPATRRADAPAPAPTADPVTPLDAPVAAASDPADEQRAAPPDPDAVPDERKLSFHGAMLIQHPGVRIAQAKSGSFELELIWRGTRHPRTVPVVEGRFALDVPVDARLRLGAGRLDGTAVHFEAPRGLFEPTDEEWALVGVVGEIVRLEVRDGPTGTPLRDVTVTRSLAEHAAWLAGSEAHAAERLVRGADSPIDLPWIDAPGPVRLHVSTPEHAPTSILVDPRRTDVHEVRLWPSADLDVTVTGPRQGEVRMLVLTRDVGGAERRHAATFAANAPGVERTSDGLLFPIRGLAAVPHTVVAKAYDSRGRIVDLGSADVLLGAREMARVEVRTER